MFACNLVDGTLPDLTVSGRRAHNLWHMVRLGPFDVMGASVDIRASKPLAGVLADALVDLTTSAPGTVEATLTVRRSVRGIWTVSWPDQERYVGPDDGVALYDVMGALNDLAARQAAARGWIGLHGGSVSIGGRAVAVVGHSGAGKSTLTAALVRAGHGFIADEISAVTPEQLVQPYHRPVGLRAGGAAAIGLPISAGPYSSTFPFVASRHGSLVGATSLAMILFIARGPEGPLVLEPLEPGDSLARLCNQTLGTNGLERDVFRALDRLVRSIPVVTLRYVDAVSAVPALVTAVAERA